MSLAFEAGEVERRVADLELGLEDAVKRITALEGRTEPVEPPTEPTRHAYYEMLRGLPGAIGYSLRDQAQINSVTNTGDTNPHIRYPPDALPGMIDAAQIRLRETMNGTPLSSELFIRIPDGVRTADRVLICYDTRLVGFDQIVHSDGGWKSMKMAGRVVAPSGDTVIKADMLFRRDWSSLGTLWSWTDYPTGPNVTRDGANLDPQDWGAIWDGVTFRVWHLLERDGEWDRIRSWIATEKSLYSRLVLDWQVKLPAELDGIECRLSPKPVRESGPECQVYWRNFVVVPDPPDLEMPRPLAG